MSYTTVEQVRRHLTLPGTPADRVYDQKFVFAADGYLSFYGNAVEENSLLVKSIPSDDLVLSPVTLALTTVTLTAGPIVPGSVVAASDSSLGMVYRENEDYSIDYTRGELTVKTGGKLTLGQTIAVWLASFKLYEAGVDYQVNYPAGEIRRLSGSDIALGETAYLDYTPVYKSFNEEILDQAVLEANGMIAAEVDPDSQFGADPVLGSAAACRALEIICRTAAAGELVLSNGDDKKALAWLKLADSYAERSEMLLKSFRPPMTGLSIPALS
ncbi:MAG: hypothetical protein ACOYVF_12900 [Candidatus Zixiibacteriota bacterium]